MISVISRAGLYKNIPKAVTRKDIRGNGQVFKPNLPKPKNEKPYKVIRYSKSIEDIRILIKFFYGDSEEKVSPSLIGEKCFDKTLEDVKKLEV